MKKFIATHLDTLSAKAKLGFTLAEILITLGVIGVVAAITIPNLIANNKAKKLRSQYLKSYSTVQQVFKLMEADDVSTDPNSYDRNEGIMFYKTFKNYLVGATDCYLKTSSPCYNFHSEKYKNLNGTAAVWKYYFDDGQIALQDGTLLLFEQPAAHPRIWIFVDLNGVSEPPNRLGYDLFLFYFADGELKAMGDNGTPYTNDTVYCSLSNATSLNGASCAHRAKTESDYFNWVVKNVK